jgi:hypothetical protein
VVAFADTVQRFFPEWEELLDLGPLRRQTYLCSAAVCMDRSLGTEVLGLLEDRQRMVDFELTFWRRAVPEYPFGLADQDVLNAILATRVGPDRVDTLDARLAATPPFKGLRVIDDRSLRCAYEDGVEPFVVHHFVLKPWLDRVHHGVYSQLLRRLLVGPDLAVRVAESEIPLRMRTGAAAYLERKRVNLRQRLRWHVTDPLSARIAPRVDALRGWARSGDS